jgi:AcrR family transcriptional regulator
VTDAVRPGGRESTRARILDTALRLFGERGFEATTMREIADACQVTERTVYRYFPFKDDLVLAQVRELIPLLRDLTTRRPAEERPFTAVWQALRALEHERPSVIGLLVRDMGERILDKSGHGTQRMVEEFAEGIAAGIRPRLSAAASSRPAKCEGEDPCSWSGPPDLDYRARILASAAISPLMTALKASVELPVEDRSVEKVNALVDEAYAAMGDG